MSFEVCRTYVQKEESKETVSTSQVWTMSAQETKFGTKSIQHLKQKSENQKFCTHRLNRRSGRWTRRSIPVKAWRQKFSETEKIYTPVNPTIWKLNPSVHPREQEIWEENWSVHRINRRRRRRLTSVETRQACLRKAEITG